MWENERESDIEKTNLMENYYVVEIFHRFSLNDLHWKHFESVRNRVIRWFFIYNYFVELESILRNFHCQIL